MSNYLLHHISLPTRNLSASAHFYGNVLNLPRLSRPDFPFGGIWFACGDRQIHIIENSEGNFRPKGQVDSRDIHLALRTADFGAAIVNLESHGYSEELAPDDPMYMRIKRDRPAGFSQLFLCDPDNHVIEINNAPVNA